MKKFLIFVFITLVYVAHQDFWNWKASDPLVFGFLPIGLAYHAGFSMLCAIMMAVLVKTAWPKHLETEEASTPAKDTAAIVSEALRLLQEKKTSARKEEPGAHS
jgi:hypothetical protein